MLLSRSLGHRPQITFTSDFHQLVQGDLIAGPCIIRYDPWRIVPESEIHHFGDLHRPIKANIRFLPSGETTELDLQLRSGAKVDYEPDPTAQGTIIKAQFMIPEGCRELECWFSYTDENGVTHWDSHEGTNYWLRFPTHDLKVLKGAISSPAKAPTAELQVIVTSTPVVDSVTLRYRVTNPCGVPRQECPLIESTGPNGGKTWSTPDGGAPVAHGATVVFDLVYTVADRKYTDDNEGTWYLAE